MGLLHTIFAGRIRYLLLQVLGQLFLVGICLGIIIWLVNSLMVILSGDNLATASNLIIHNGVIALGGLLALLLFGDTVLVAFFNLVLVHTHGERGGSHTSEGLLNGFWRVYSLKLLYVGVALFLFSLLFWIFGLSNSSWFTLAGDAEPDVLLFPIILWGLLLFLLLWISWGFNIGRVKQGQYWVVTLVSYLVGVLGLSGFVYLHSLLFDLGYVWASLGVVFLALVWFVLVRYVYLYFSSRVDVR